MFRKFVLLILGLMLSSLMLGTQFIVPLEADGTIHVDSSPIHDVAILNIELKLEIDLYHIFVIPPDGHAYPSWHIEVYVTVRNEGMESENFSVTAYYDNNTIGTKAIIDLAPETNKTLKVRWSLHDVPLGIYTLWAYASEVSGETDTADNTKVWGSLPMGPGGDVDGDGHVYVLDLSILGTYWRGWYPYADFNMDGEVYVQDLSIMGAHWRQHV